MNTRGVFPCVSMPNGVLRSKLFIVYFRAWVTVKICKMWYRTNHSECIESVTSVRQSVDKQVGQLQPYCEFWLSINLICEDNNMNL
jgi:hypothetical protein